MPDHPFHAKQNQRKERDRIQPHDVPVVGCHVGAHRIKHRRKQCSRRLRSEMSAHIGCRGKPAKPCFDQDQHRHEFQEILPVTKNEEQIQRTGQIIGIGAQEIRSESQIPGIKRTPAVLETILKLRKKRRILMIHINMQEL